MGYKKYFHVWEGEIYYYCSAKTQVCLKAGDYRCACLEVVSTSQSNSSVPPKSKEYFSVPCQEENWDSHRLLKSPGYSQFMSVRKT